MTLAILIHETHETIEQIHIDIEPSKTRCLNTSGRATFIGQWPDIDVVIMKAESSGIIKNMNILPKPFEDEEVYGKILLMRMDENSEPQDFTVDVIFYYFFPGTKASSLRTAFAYFIHKLKVYIRPVSHIGNHRFTW